MSHLPTWRAFPNVISSLESECGPSRFAEQVGQIADLAGQAVVHASLSARQAKALGLTTSGTCGLTGTGSSNSADLQSSLESRLRQKLSFLG
jgi:hypothetical protein